MPRRSITQGRDQPKYADCDGRSATASPTQVARPAFPNVDKTTLAHELGRSLGSPVLCRDEIKQGMARCARLHPEHGRRAVHADVRRVLRGGRPSRPVRCHRDRGGRVPGPAVAARSGTAQRARRTADHPLYGRPGDRSASCPPSVGRRQSPRGARRRGSAPGIPTTAACRTTRSSRSRCPRQPSPSIRPTGTPRTSPRSARSWIHDRSARRVTAPQLYGTWPASGSRSGQVPYISRPGPLAISGG